MDKFLEVASVAVLKEKLGALGLSSSGTKGMLRVRLADALNGKSADEIAEVIGQTNEEQSDEDTGMVESLDEELARLRELIEKKKEIAALREALADTSVRSNSNFNFNDIESMAQCFSGDSGITIHKFIEQFEDAADIFKLNEKAKFVYGKRLVKGTAMIFLRTINVKTWCEMRDALFEEFNNDVTAAEIHNRLRNRKKKRNETCQQYVFAMMEISSMSKIEETDLVNYIIEGIPDSFSNKMILYGANTISELKNCLKKYEIMKMRSWSSSTQPSNQQSFSESTNLRNQQSSSVSTNVQCFRCKEMGHYSNQCKKNKKFEATCYNCGKEGHFKAECRSFSKNQRQEPKQHSINEIEEHHSSDIGFEHQLQYEFVSNTFGENFKLILSTLVDSGSPISFIQQHLVPDILVENIWCNKVYRGINGSQLQVIGKTESILKFRNKIFKINLLVVKKNSMSYNVILGRDFLKSSGVRLIFPEEKKCDTSWNNHVEAWEKEILNIDVSDIHGASTCEFNINNNLSFDLKQKLSTILSNAIVENHSKFTENDIKLDIKLINSQPFCCAPRRLPYTHKLELKKIIDDLLKRHIIKESCSPYASPIVLVAKKNKEMRLCIDYRNLNKITVRDNYPLPLIEDLIDRLKGKKYFSILDLKGGFHHVTVAEDSVQYTSFVTPLGQYEFIKMPFGLRNAPSVFHRYINNIFKDLLVNDKLLIYMDDLLIATESLTEHFNILKQVLDLVKNHSLELRWDKCKFMQEEIKYLGYEITVNGVAPNNENLIAVQNFPVPTNIKLTHSFIGLCSYFRKFIRNFALIAKPLYDLLRKDAVFKFNKSELESFELLKSKLLQSPILSIYSPTAETELHCDASSIGYGSILLQRQDDGKFHPIFYFSKRTTDVESRYHSYELETLSIIYALRRFKIYLTGIKFKIVTDCQSLTLTLNKKLINPRIQRWVLEMQDFDYTVEHRISGKMSHVDALSRSTGIFTVANDTFETALVAAQNRDANILKLKSDLEKNESKFFTLINGLVYRKKGDDVMFNVPSDMESRVIQTHHESLCHLGTEKCFDYLRKTYWFPNMKIKIEKYIKTCLKCIEFSTKSGKVEGVLHNIPKGKTPFDVLHIDHYGPLPNSQNKMKHIFLIVDGFTKFSKLYAVKSTTSVESIKCLESYFSTYSRPSKIISDRGTSFTSQIFKDFMSKNNIQHVKVASFTPQANGQVERINRILTPMFSKEADSETTSNWYKNLYKIEFALNNTKNRSSGFSPSLLLFGVEQKGEFCDKVLEYIQDKVQTNNDRNLYEIREKASDNLIRNQNINKIYYDKKHKMPHAYDIGDYVMLRNLVTTPGINKKFLPKFRGPYEVVKKYDNDRYLVKDIEGLQMSRIPYEGICSPINMKLYMSTSM